MSSNQAIIPERFEALTNWTPATGGHGDGADPLNGQACTIECGRWLYGLAGDRGPEESPAIGAAARALNDAITDAELRRELMVTTPSIDRSITVRAPLSRGSEALELARGWSAVDFAVRTVLPTWLDLLAQSRPDAERHALALRALSPIACEADLAATESVRREAREFCRAARAAAWAAARAAARAAAGAAAGDAARDFLAPAVVMLQRETAAWIHRMLDMTEPDALPEEDACVTVSACKGFEIEPGVWSGCNAAETGATCGKE